MKSSHIGLSLLFNTFPYVLPSDVLDGINTIRTLNHNIIGRICGNYADKLAQYLSIINFCRETGCNTISSLEIGSLFGGSCLIKLLAMRNIGITGQVFCIDPMAGYYGMSRDPISGIPVNSDFFWSNIKAFGFSHNDVVLMPYFSNDPSAYNAVKDKTFSTIMIDGDHSYQGVAHDWNCYARLISDKGFILIDDFAEQAWPEITKFADEHLNMVPGRKSVIGNTYVIKYCRTHESIPDVQMLPEMHSPIPDELEYFLDETTLKLNLANVYLKLRNQGRAEALYLAGLKSDSSHSIVHNFIASVGLSRLYVDHDLSKANTLIDSASFESVPSFARTFDLATRYADILVDLGRPENAITVLSDHIVVAPVSRLEKIQLLTKIGEIEFSQNNYSKAIKFAESSLMMPEIPAHYITNSILLLGKCYKATGQLDREESLYRNALIGDNFSGLDRFGLLLRLGNVLTCRDFFEDAEKVYDEALTISELSESKKVDALIALCICYKRQKKYDQGKEILNTLLAHFVLSASQAYLVYLNFADISRITGNQADAITGFQKCLSIDNITCEQFGNALLGLSQCLADIGQTKIEEQTYHAALQRELLPIHRFQVLLRLGQLYAKQSRINEAHAILTEAMSIETVPEADRSHINQLYSEVRMIINHQTNHSKR